MEIFTRQDKTQTNRLQKTFQETQETRLVHRYNGVPSTQHI